MYIQESEQQLTRPHHPVSVRFNGHEFESNGISFEDFNRMSTRQHVLNLGRANKCPAWAINIGTTAKVVASFMEMRAGLRKPGTGTIKERIERAERRIKENLPSKRVQLVETLHRHMRARGAERERLAVLCENLDTQIVIAAMGARLVTGVISFYFLQGWNSVDTGRALGIKPPHVRQVVYRLNRCWRDLNGEQRTKMCGPKPCARCKKEFKPTRGGDRHKYCSSACQRAAEHDRRTTYCSGQCCKAKSNSYTAYRRRKYRADAD